MERLRLDDPPQIGPYITLARLDAEGTAATVPERRLIARSADGDRTVIACLPRIGADPARWAVEAEGARRLSIPGLLPVTEAGGTAGFPWHAAQYVPALPLPAVLEAQGGPLPEAVVRSLGAALAQTLATAHAQGVTHAGLCPAAVLVSAEGPRLTCFGAVRSAAADSEQRAGLAGLDSGSLAPEQAQGGRPRPLGDVYALGAVLSYASTGHTVPERDELPASLRQLITACLARDPAMRPQAHQVLGDLTSSAPGTAPQGTVLDTAAAFPLPALVVAALARQSAQVLAAELPTLLPPGTDG
ncbi:serine/threonine protein kinase [Streptomyces lunaelactis]|uniref:Serine/threonine protein kinase n=1 Tax=Streptomyces lunaelactis TaxID=1535768 RepID=A0A2R4T2E0_9ACTN|nr:serine/threonine protein kinase [Streptomyces lunaelactis]AVZ73300.1 serine/threonine protein kinase [Streptomyces lunaelactis]NUK87562.1 serine/threonine protein kinase [Streptomyces lunaelactis]